MEISMQNYLNFSSFAGDLFDVVNPLSTVINSYT